MRKVTLFAVPGSGSAIVEAQLAWLGIEHTLEDAGNIYESEDARRSLARFNPLSQVPTLLLDDGTVLTESAAITLFLAEASGREDLVPPPNSADRARFLRWLIFLVAAVYPTLTFSDMPDRYVAEPSAREGFCGAVTARVQEFYRILDGEASEPWFLGGRLSAIDFYLWVLSHWRPGRRWLAGNAGRILAIAEKVDALPQLKEVKARHFPSP